MTSDIDSSSPRLRPVPRGQSHTWWLWPQPISPGFYGKERSGRVWITTNHLPSVVAAGQAGTLVLAVEAGGLHPTIAAAFDCALVEDARHQLEELIESTNINIVQVDPALARRLSVELNSKQGQSTPHVSSAPGADRSQISQRLVGAIVLTLGQAVIIAWPLLLFGWHNLAAGLGILFAAGLVLGLLWPLPRRKCVVCRLVLSTLSALLAVVIAWVGFNLDPERLAWLAGCWWLASFWMSFVFMGIRAST